MVFVKKSNILSRVFISQIRPEKIVLDILDRKEGFLDQKSEVLKRPENPKFLKGDGPWFLSRNRTFCQGCLFCKLDQVTSFFDILD